MWTCPKCGRQFERRGQSHSCRSFPIEKHFEGKPAGKLLYDKLSRAIRKQLGPYKTESLECCIHFVSTFTFAAAKIYKDRIRVDFALSRKIRNRRLERPLQMSAHKYLYVIDISSEAEIDKQLLGWIEEAYLKKVVEPAT